MNHLAIDEFFVGHRSLVRVQVSFWIVIMQPFLPVSSSLLVEDLVDCGMTLWSGASEEYQFALSQIGLKLLASTRSESLVVLYIPTIRVGRGMPPIIILTIIVEL